MQSSIAQSIPPAAPEIPSPLERHIPATLLATQVTDIGLVTNSAGDELGSIEAIMLDVAAGRIAYAVLSFGGFLGLGSKLFAVPWPALRLDASHRRFILEISREKLESAEGFDESHWPTTADPDWAQRLHSHYDVPLHWSAAHYLRGDSIAPGIDAAQAQTGLHF